MIIKSFELRKYINKKNIYLIYGENEGLKEDLIFEISSNYSKESIFKYQEKEIWSDLNNFYNSIFSLSFFINKKLIIIYDVSEKFKNEVEIILNKNISDVTLVLITKTLEKKSKIRNYFEKEKDLIVIPVYKDNHKILLDIAFNFFKTKKIHISTESLNLIIERCAEDRKNLKNELEKIESFIGNKRNIDLNDLIKLTNLSENHSVNKVVDLTLAKNKKQTIKALNENIYSSEDVIVIIRSFLFKSKRLLKLTEELEKNKNINIDQIISSSKPPIFWKEKEIVKKQMMSWSKDNVKQLIKNINKIELIMKKNTNSSLNILRDFIIEQSSKVNN